LAADISISIGLALQKVANTRIQNRAARRNPQSMRVNGASAAEPAISDLLAEPTWIMGIIVTVASEIGNFAAYGDPNTPSAIVASLGCVCVLCNWVVSIIWLKEPFRVRDVLGVILVISGVICIVVFVPKSPTAGTLNLLPCPIVYWGRYDSAPCGIVPEFWYSGHSFNSADLAPGPQVCEHNLVVVGSDYWYMYQPVWLAYFVCALSGLVASTMMLKKHGPKHPVLSLLPADIAGGFTVCAAVTVSTFLFDYVFKKGHWFALAEPIFWVCVAILAGTAVFQVSYLNKVRSK
jgi:multidrug transporter EmrE-like cation transporter